MKSYCRAMPGRKSAHASEWFEGSCIGVPLPQIPQEVAPLAVRVDEHLEKMGAV